MGDELNVKKMKGKSFATMTTVTRRLLCLSAATLSLSVRWTVVSANSDAMKGNDGRNKTRLD